MVLEDVGIKLIGEDAGDAHGQGVPTLAAAMGDLTGDGVLDAVVGMPNNARGGTGAGTVYVVGGPVTTSTDLSLATALIMGEADEEFGYAIAVGGDVDGDGAGDLIVGAPAFREHTGSFEGQAYLFSGPIIGELTSASATATLHGELEDEFGYGDESDTGSAIAFAGDVNGDGYADILVAAPGYPVFRGVAYLLPGPISGNIELSSVAWRLSGAEDGSSSVGTSVSGAGDVDGDGLDDIIISTPGDGGVAALLFTEVDPDTEPTVGDASATYTSASGHYAAGWSSKSGGDINGDGYVDLLIYDVGTTGAGVEVGVLAVVYGPALGTVDLSTLSPRIAGTSATDGFGVEFANVGDMDGDGFADVAVGAPDPWPTGAGSVYLFPGPLAGSLDTDDAAIRFLGDGEDMAGWTLSAAGDTDGDGRDDLLVGAAGDDDGGMLAGAVWLVAGSVL